MASEDVIELGSSDDEAEPATKKRKPLPDAMVHIPNELPGVTIKPSKANQFRKRKVVLPKQIIISKSVYNVNSNVTKNKQLGGAFQVPSINFPRTLKAQISLPKKCSLNPLNLNKNIIRPQLSGPLKTVLKPTEVKGSKLLNSLPPDITISVVQKVRRSEINKQSKTNAPQNMVELLTVDVDDEEVSDTITAKTASPQWYLRPEEPSVNKEEVVPIKAELKSADSLEEQNNKEPESTKFVEITIEDSPLKLLSANPTSEIGKELAITIEDSPAKVITHISKNVGSDNEDKIMKVPHSKKKLEYPKQSERQVVEIEIDLMDTGSVPVDISDDKDVKQKETTNTEDKTINLNYKTGNDDSKTNTGEEDDQTKENVDGTSNNEFHPIYQNFMNMCFKLENSEDMIKIVEKKIKAYYKQCPKEFVESEDFIDLVSSKIVSMKADPEKMYLYIKDIVDELNLQRKMAKSTIITKNEESPDSSKTVEEDEGVYNSKKKKQIRKLEKTIKKLHRAIQKLEEQEVDFDDDEESVYLLTEKYKERMVRVHKKFCQLTNTKMPSEPRLHVETRPGRPVGPARKLEKWINKKVPVGSLLPFPDFHDVLRCVRDSNSEDKLGWNEYDIMEEARDLFTRCGRKLQRRRQENEWRLAASRITQNADPAEINDDLKKKLNDNKVVATSKEVDLLNQFAEKQKQLKLEAVEIGDKEAEESPEESDEEEEEGAEISNTLENKQKRKDKLKTLLQDKSKNTAEKVGDGKTINETERENKLVDNAEPEKQNNETDKTDNAEPNTENSKLVSECTENSEAILEKNETDQVESGNDSDKVESDIDELHLYQKSGHSLYLNHEAYSSFGSSDSDTPIAISDTLDSDSDVETDKKQSDIISIENSSYSESESANYDTFPKTSYDENLINDKLEVEYPKEQNMEYVDLENILLASSDDEDTNKVVDEEIGGTFINLKDDNISISETMVHGETVERDAVNNDGHFSSENKNPTTSPQESPTNGEEHMMIQECYEEDENDAAMETSKGNEEINAKGSLKEIVDIRSLSDGTSIGSIEMQTDICNKVDEQIEPDIQENEANENSCDGKISEAVEPVS